MKTGIFRQRACLAALALGVATSLAGQADAATCTSVSVSTSSVAFGPYNPINSSNVDSTGGVTVACPSPADTLPPLTSITISEGRSGTYFSRNMSNGTSTLNYNLYVDTSRTQVWGDGLSGTSDQSFSGGADSVTFNVFGRIPQGQNTATAGSYSDPTLTVTVNY